MSGDVAVVMEVSPSYMQKAGKSPVPSGYKRTEVGVIPKDWSSQSIAEFSNIKTGPFGTLLKASEYSKGHGVPLISVGEIGVGKFRVSQHTPLISEDIIRRLPQYLLKKGDIVFGRKGAVDRSALVTDQEAGWFLGSDGISIRPDQNNDPAYLAYQFQRHEVQQWLLQNASGTTMASLNQAVLGSVRIPCPPKNEQRGIATALSDVDALLEELNRLIAKKRDLKQATMQQLLTGKTRLPGFEGGWETVRLGDHATFLRNGTNSRAELASDGSVRYLHYGDIHACSSATLKPDNLPFLPDHKTKSLDKLQTGDLIFADASEDMEGVGKSVEIVDLNEQKVVSGLHTIAVRFNKPVLADGFKAYLQSCPSFINQLRRLAAGTKVYATTRKHIASIELALPCVAEQQAIASIFSTMDAEIHKLEQRHSKTVSLKQAMMQELLTGRTRLV